MVIANVAGEGGQVGWQRRWRRTARRVVGALKRRFGALASWLRDPALAEVPVSAAMLSRVDTVSAHAPLADVARLFVAGRVAELPVVDRGRVVGVVTRDGLAAALARSGPEASVGVAPRQTVITVAPSDSLGDVLARLRARPDAIALVVDHGAPVGVLTEERLAAYLDSLAA